MVNNPSIRPAISRGVRLGVVGFSDRHGIVKSETPNFQVPIQLLGFSAGCTTMVGPLRAS